MRVLPVLVAGAALVLSAFSVAAQTAAAGQAAGDLTPYVGGEVMFVSGAATRVLANGSKGAVAKGMTLLEGDRVTTQADSHVYVRLRDGGLLVVRPASELKVDRWRFDPAAPQESQIKYTLESGVARHVSGQGAKAARDKFRFNTPVAAIGVRGTDFTVLADPALTRVSVQTGGVIVNSLGNGCRAEGFGPCEGDSAVELFAAKDKLVQLRMGERRAEIIEGVNAGPDKSRPPANGEPTASRSNAGTVVSEARTPGFVDQVANVELIKPQPPEPRPEPITVAAWGRWTSIANNDPGVVSAADVLAGRELVGISNHYVLAANKLAGPVELPGASSVSFKLIGHDGVVVDRSTGRGMISSASDGALKIDFGTRRFETSLAVKAEDVSGIVRAQGSVESTGRFVSDSFVSQGIIQGLVGGKNASEAVYLYQRALNDRYDASGVASWRK